MRSLIPVFFSLILLSSCSVYENIPTVSFRGPTLQGVQTKVDLQEVKVDLGSFGLDQLSMQRHDDHTRSQGAKEFPGMSHLCTGGHKDDGFAFQMSLDKRVDGIQLVFERNYDVRLFQPLGCCVLFLVVYSNIFGLVET